MTPPQSPQPGPRRGKRIAIDGPAASGKSTLGAALADRLGYTYVDSGVVYRAVTLLALRQGVDLADAEALARIAQDLRIEVARPTAETGASTPSWSTGRTSPGPCAPPRWTPPSPPSPPSPPCARRRTTTSGA